MAAQVDIYNYALGNIGSSDTVASLDERSKQANVCNRFYPLARDSMLADFDWPFATRYETLALLTSTIPGWSFVYQYPSDCLRLLAADNRPFWPESDVTLNRYQVGYGDSGQVILSNNAGATAAYVSRIDDSGRMPPLFVEALGWKLASMIAMPLTNTRSVAETAASLYQQAVQAAWASALNESDPRVELQSEYIQARGADYADMVYRNWGRN